MASMDFERQSFENVVEFYREELLEVHHGVSARKVFTDDTVRRLRKKNVILINRLGRKGSWFKLSAEARACLGLFSQPRPEDYLDEDYT